MSRLNIQNRTLAIMDNLRFLRSINNECIDLIAMDPPFAANETFTGQPRPPITDAEMEEERALAESHGAEYNEGVGETRVHDVWSWDDDVHPAWKARIEDEYEAIFKVIEAVESSASENEAAYITYMAVRLLECRRVLKETGSIYIHCDSHANSYLRLLMNAIFGSENFRNEITWPRSPGRASGRHWGNTTDTILFFSKTSNYTWHDTRRQTGNETPTSVPLDAAGIRHGESGLPWRGYNPTTIGRHWAVPRIGTLAYWIEENAIPNYTSIESSHERLDALDQAGLVRFSRNGRPSIIRPVEADAGTKVNSLWDDIKLLSATSSERTGYATQKPLALYERIIAASSNEGDVVLDVFAGCATTAVAAQNLKRQWIACDMAYRSWTMLKRRFYLSGYALSGMTSSTQQALGVHQPALQEAKSQTIGPHNLPIRDDSDPAIHYPLGASGGRRGRVPTQTASWSGRISKEDAKRLLIDRFGPVCWGCGYEPRRPNGTLDDTLLEVDHIRARRPTAGSPGDDELYNLALLHRTCNGIKRNSMTLEQLREHNALNGLLYVNNQQDLVDLFEATKFANEQIAIHAATYGVQESLASYDAEQGGERDGVGHRIS